jgi:uncharacterized protein YwqG
MRTGRITAFTLLLSLGACGGPSDGATSARADSPARPASPQLPLGLDVEGLRREMRRRGLERIEEQLAKMAKPCLLLRRRDGAPPAAPTSRFGGAPDLPPDVEWPQWRGVPQAFVAQVRLEELPAGVIPELPPRGVLSFFYDSEQSAWGIDSKDLGCFRVIYTEHAETCVSREFPGDLDERTRYRHVPLRMEPALSLPDRWSADVAALALDDARKEAIGELAYELHYRGEGHQIGGEPSPIQDGNMAASVAALVDGANARGTDWVLLLQVESDDAAGFMWGDMGALYFWIRRADLAALRLDRAWMVFECS